jgi:hypothetical protein
MERFIKDPNADLDYTVDWSVWLPAGDTISVSAWTVPGGLTSDQASNTTTTAKIWLQSGTVGTAYTVSNRITTTAGRVNDQSFIVVIEEL